MSLCIYFYAYVMSRCVLCRLGGGGDEEEEEEDASCWHKFGV